MGDILIRNIDKDVIEAWKRRAAGKGRSLQAELQDELTKSVRWDRKAAAIEAARRSRESADMSKMDCESWELIREGRDSR